MNSIIIIKIVAGTAIPTIMLIAMLALLNAEDAGWLSRLFIICFIGYCMFATVGKLVQQVQTQEITNDNVEVQSVDLNGKSYVLVDEKAYEIVETDN